MLTGSNREGKTMKKEKILRSKKKKQVIWIFQAKITQDFKCNTTTYCFIEVFIFGDIICPQIPEKRISLSFLIGNYWKQFTRNLELFENF